MARAMVDYGHDLLPLVQRALLHDHGQRLVVTEPKHVANQRAAVAVLAFDCAHVGNLAAPGGVEGGLGELDEVAAVRLRHRPDGRVLTLCLIAREMRLKAAARGERARRVAPAGAIARAVGSPRRPAARALLLHELLEVTLDAKPLAGEQLAGHLVGEAVG